MHTRQNLNYLLNVCDLITKYILTIKFGWDTKAGYAEPHVTRLDSSPSNLFRDSIGPKYDKGKLKMIDHNLSWGRHHMKSPLYVALNTPASF